MGGTGGVSDSGATPSADPVGRSPTARRFEADLVLVGDTLRSDAAILVDEAGRITAIGDAAELPRPAATRRYSGAILPGAVNAHSHAFQILLRGWADSARDFRDWVDNHMYRLALAVEEEDIALGSELGFAEMLLNGVTTVGEFFYLHNGPASTGCEPRGNRNAEAVIAAARRVGIRIHLLRCLYDVADKPGQRRFHEPASDAVAATATLAGAAEADDAVTVGIAPHSLHGATPDGIQAAAEYAAAREQPFQIHLAEEKHDLDHARRRYGTSPGRALQQLGVLSERTCVVHGVWLDDDEIAALGDCGGLCAYNPISNMALGDGVTDLPAMVEAGVTVALGCDGPGANHQVDVWQEMRFAEWLQRVVRLRMNVVHPAAVAAGRARTSSYCFEMGTRNGGRVLGLQVGCLQPGYWADFVVVDTGDLSMLPRGSDDPAALLHVVVGAMSARGAVSHVVVGGEEVVSDGRLRRVDGADLARRGAAWRLPEEGG